MWLCGTENVSLSHKPGDIETETIVLSGGGLGGGGGGTTARMSPFSTSKDYFSSICRPSKDDGDRLALCCNSWLIHWQTPNCMAFYRDVIPDDTSRICCQNDHGNTVRLKVLLGRDASLHAECRDPSVSHSDDDASCLIARILSSLVRGLV